MRRLANRSRLLPPTKLVHPPQIHGPCGKMPTVARANYAGSAQPTEFYKNAKIPR